MKDYIIFYIKNIIKIFLSLQKDHVKVPLHALFNTSIIAKLSSHLSSLTALGMHTHISI